METTKLSDFKRLSSKEIQDRVPVTLTADGDPVCVIVSHPKFMELWHSNQLTTGAAIITALSLKDKKPKRFK